MGYSSQTQVFYLSGIKGREDKEKNKKDMQQKVGLSLSSVIKLWPRRKQRHYAPQETEC